MMFKGWIVGAGLAGALLAGLAGADPARADNLTDAMTGAYRTSGLLAQNRALLRAADEDVAIAMAALRPIVTWTNRIRRNWSDDVINGIESDSNVTTAFFGLTAEMLLYDNGASRLAIDSAKETVLATRQALIAVEQNVLLRAVQAYMNVRRQQEFVSLRRNNVRLLGEELRAAQDRFDVGEVTRTDVALAESALAEARSNLADALGSLREAQEEYRLATGNSAEGLAPPPALPERPATIQAAQSIGVRTHPLIQQARHQIAAAELNVMRSRAQLGPTVVGSANIGRTADDFGFDDNEDISLSIELNQRIYQGGERSALIRRSQAQRDQQRAALLETTEDVEFAIASSFIGVEVAQAQLASTDEQIRAARTAFEGVREEATLGARTTLDVLDAEQNLLDAQTLRISAQADLYIASYNLLSAMGLLTAERLGLPVQRYDPSAYYNMVKDGPTITSRQGRQLDRVLRAIGKE